MPESVWRDLWVNVKPMRRDKWRTQAAGPWLRAEAIQRAFRKGRQDEADEQRQHEIEERRRKDAAKPSQAEQASLDRLKGRMSG